MQDSSHDYSQYRVSESMISQSNYQQSYIMTTSKKLKLKLKRKKIYRTKNKGSWLKDEQFKFVQFLKTNRLIFQQKMQRRKFHIFKQMQVFIQSRSSQQCRSHYQKYELRFGNFDNIVKHIEKKINQTIFRKKDFYKMSTNNKKIQRKNLKSMSEKQQIQQEQKIIQNLMFRNNQNEIKKEHKQQKTNLFQSENIIEYGKGFKILQNNPNELNFKICIELQTFWSN